VVGCTTDSPAGRRETDVPLGEVSTAVTGLAQSVPELAELEFVEDASPSVYPAMSSSLVLAQLAAVESRNTDSPEA
jgi:hypothetical protein